MALNPQLLELLVCPLCRGTLELVDGEAGLRCAACALVFPIRDEIPIMLEEEAVPLGLWQRGERSIKTRSAPGAAEDASF